MTMAKQWELWTPDIRIANSVAGVSQYFEISKRSHASLQSNGPSSTRVEVYPTFSIKMACKFDYSAYPFDEQACALRLYTAQPMREVQLSVYYNIPPTVLLGWGRQSAKKHVSDWELLSITNNISYYSDRKFSYKAPTSGAQFARTCFKSICFRSILLTWITVRRIAIYYGIALVLPGIVSMLFNILSFLVPKSEHSFYILVANFFIQAIFLQDVVFELPPAVGNAPKIVRFGEWTLIETIVALFLHFWIRRLEAQNQRSTGKMAKFALNFVPGHSEPKLFPDEENAASDEASLIGSDAPYIVTVVKSICAACFFLFSLLISLIYLI
ncbi:hypothetical protein L596_024404 [Steinernema carpocapsae]|uniref:Neurotransmitter-gated ion-channel ligand-binding domain-containing protein n=1 Tax=Steinernema carpocapsae TaxID=34508 RepID=A0A4V5ZZR1_STECR|nr:hypothetical protein L596_024404 [Steinernema carpocapsae]